MKVFLFLLLFLGSLFGASCTTPAPDATSAPAFTIDSAQWQRDVRFPNWITTVNTSASNIVPFQFYHGQGTLYVTLERGCTSCSLYVNNRKVKISKKALQSGGTLSVDIAPYTKDGTNTLQVCDIVPKGMKNAVRVCVPYPVVKKGTLKDSGLSKASLSLIDALITSDIQNGFSSAQLAVIKDGRLVYQNSWGAVQTYDERAERISAPAVTNDTLYDIASVTKMFSVNYAIQYLIMQEKLSLETKLVDVLGTSFVDDTIAIAYKNRAAVPLSTNKAWKESLTVRDVLSHSAGEHVGPSYFNDRIDVASGAVGDDKTNVLYAGSDGSAETREKTLAQLCRTPLVYEPRTDVVYSDVDFMLLCFVIEKITGQPLDDFLRETFWKPLGLTHITYNPLQHGFCKTDCAATEICGNTLGGFQPLTEDDVAAIYRLCLAPNA